MDQKLVGQGLLNSIRKSIVSKPEQRYLDMLELSLEPMFIQIDGKIVLLNQSALEFFKADNPWQVFNLPVLHLLHPDYVELVRQRIAQLNMKIGPVPEIDEVWVTLDGEAKDVRVKAVPIEYQGKSGALVILKDMTKSKSLERALLDQSGEHMSTMSSHEKLLNHLEALKKSDVDYFFILLEMREYEGLRRSFGQYYADGVLTAVETRLRKLYTGGYIIRVGITLAIVQICASSDVFKTITAIQACFLEPFSIKYGQLGVSYNLGVVKGRSKSLVHQIYRDAETALLQAKSKGRNQSAVFEPDVVSEISGNSQALLERHLLRALELNEMKLYLQPISRVQDNRIVGAEALIRWQHRELGLLSPGKFLPLAQELNLLSQIDRWVLRQVALYFPHMEERKLEYLSVNLCSEHFNDPVSHQQTLDLIAGFEQNCSKLKVEITENTILGEHSAVAESLFHLCRLGVKISVDDFGTGYSSLGYLNNLRVDCLKIDQSFIHNLEFSNTSRAITKNILSLAKDLHLEVTAEGVETPAQLDALRGWDCDLAQGYFVGLPIAAEHFIDFLKVKNEQLSHQLC